jgi:hypothetical protein
MAAFLQTLTTDYAAAATAVCIASSLALNLLPAHGDLASKPHKLQPRLLKLRHGHTTRGWIGGYRRR